MLTFCDKYKIVKILIILIIFILIKINIILKNIKLLITINLNLYIKVVGKLFNQVEDIKKINYYF